MIAFASATSPVFRRKTPPLGFSHHIELDPSNSRADIHVGGVRLIARVLVL
jgi:hypothetical protein